MARLCSFDHTYPPHQLLRNCCRNFHAAAIVEIMKKLPQSCLSCGNMTQSSLAGTFSSWVCGDIVLVATLHSVHTTSAPPCPRSSDPPSCLFCRDRLVNLAPHATGGSVRSTWRANAGRAPQKVARSGRVHLMNVNLDELFAPCFALRIFGFYFTAVLVRHPLWACRQPEEARLRSGTPDWSVWTHEQTGCG